MPLISFHTLQIWISISYVIAYKQMGGDTNEADTEVIMVIDMYLDSQAIYIQHRMLIRVHVQFCTRYQNTST